MTINPIVNYVTTSGNIPLLVVSTIDSTDGIIAGYTFNVPDPVMFGQIINISYINSIPYDPSGSIGTWN